MISRNRLPSKGFPKKPKEKERARKPFKRAEWKPTPKEERPLAKVTPLARTPNYGGSSILPTAPGKGKPQAKVRHDIRQSAKGEECTVRIPGACWGDVIWSHARWGSAAKGRSTKALDICGAMCCLGCDSVFDGQTPPPPGVTREQIDLAWMHGHLRSLVRLAEKGLL